jgi:hypothetical protein
LLFVFAVCAVTFSIFHYHVDKDVADLYIEKYGDKMDRTLKKIAGPDAFNCGRLAVKKGELLENRCAPKADEEQHAFYATYTLQTDSGSEIRGIARDPAGHYAEYKWYPGNDMTRVYFGPDPEPVPCTGNFRITWQGRATCTDER